MVGYAEVLADALVGLACPDVQVTQGVGAVPVPGLRVDNLDVLGNGGLDAALPQRLLGALERPFTIERRHGGSPQAIVSNSVGGLNDRRCCTE
jgi:hypothetical protein